jgi:protein TonB
MKHLKESQHIAGQSNVNVKKTQKHDVNLQKNATLYFQMGLILCLLAVYSLLEMKFESKDYVILQPPPIEDFDEIDIKNFKEYRDEMKTIEPIKNVQKLGAKNPVIKPDDTPNIDAITHVISEPTITNTPVDPGSIKVDKIIDEDFEIFSIIDVEKVPIYPGCESASNNKERIKCMSDKLSKLVQKKFNTDLASGFGLSGTQKIDVAFRIDKQGHITDIKARAPHPQLEKEAFRIAEKIPTMKPGLQRNKPVSVMYNLPIVFKVQ